MTASGIAHKRSAQFEIQDELEALFRLDGEPAGELLLVRHAQPAFDSHHDGDDAAAEPMLSCEGLRQAERLADRLGSLCLDAVYTAPERRCYQTAKVVADLLERPLRVNEDLAEIEFDAETAAGAQGGYAARFSQHPRWDSLPGFTRSQTFRCRSIAAIESIISAHMAGRCLVITHASVINAYVGMLLTVPRDLLFAPDHASLTTIRHRADLYGLRSLNDTSHLDVTIHAPAFTPRSLPLTNR